MVGKVSEGGRIGMGQGRAANRAILPGEEAPLDLDMVGKVSEGGRIGMGQGRAANRAILPG